MALSQKHRSSLYAKLSPVVGEEGAEALLLQFPSRDEDEPATKDFVRAEIAEVKAEIANLRGEMQAGFGKLEARMTWRLVVLFLAMVSAVTAISASL